MLGLRFARHNNCPRCPVIGTEDIPEKNSSSSAPCDSACMLRANGQAVDAAPRRPRWTRVVGGIRLPPSSSHDHLHTELGLGFMVTFPARLRRPLTDGSHRAARVLRDRTEFLVHLLPEAETLELLRRSMGKIVADAYWQRMAHFQPHPNNVPQGEQ